MIVTGIQRNRYWAVYRHSSHLFAACDGKNTHAESSTKMTDQDYWFSNQKMKKQQAENQGVFQHYRNMRESQSLEDYIHIQNDNCVRGKERAQIYKSLLRFKPASIADIGCGIGLTTAHLRRTFPDSECYGIEASIDAVEIAKRRFGAECVFLQEFVDNSLDLNKKFDVVLFQEFYPFTRTGNFSPKLPFLEFAERHLSDRGCILIQLANRHPDETILNNLAEVEEFCVLNDLTMRQHSIPLDRLVTYVYFPKVALLFTSLVSKLFGVDERLVLSLSRPLCPTGLI
jgi:SAM-dependent methyltransferase